MPDINASLTFSLINSVFDLVYYLFVFCGGAFIGSFLNVVSDRLENGKPIVYGRSQCESCKKELGVFELIPIVSFILQKGKCKSCGARLSFYYLFSEAITGFTFALIAYWLGIFGTSNPYSYVAFAFYLIVSSFLIVILLSDLKYMIIPDKVVFSGIGFVLLYQLGSLAWYAYYLYSSLSQDEFGKMLIKAGYFKNSVSSEFVNLLWIWGAAFFVSLFFLLLIILTKGRGMGGGDVKLGFLLGLLNGFPNFIVMLFLAFLTGALFSLFLVALKRRSLKEAIPFGPFLILGCYLALFFGTPLVEWYLKLI